MDQPTPTPAEIAVRNVNLPADAAHVPDVSDEALEISGNGSSVMASQLTTVQQNCCR